MHKPPKRPQSIVDHNHHDLLARRQTRKIVGSLVPRQVTAAVYPQHHRKRSRDTLRVRRIDVQIQAILGTQIFTRSATRRHTLRLRAHHRLAQRGNRLLWRVDCYRRHPTSLANRRLRISDVTIDHRTLRPRFSDNPTATRFPNWSGTPIPVGKRASGQKQRQSAYGSASEKHVHHLKSQ